MMAFEVNFDGLVGPTHHYAGLAKGNIASTSHALSIANPKAAALQGIEKMRALHQLGLKQALLPPHLRPNLKLLHEFGFRGSIANQLQCAARDQPELLRACFSASAMWTANAATITPSMDSLDSKTHFTAANLISNLHRHQEALFSHQLLKRIFADDRHFTHHLPLPACTAMSDEGAANHSRLCLSHKDKGLHLFVYGKEATNKHTLSIEPKQYPARQTRESQLCIARRHQLSNNQCLFVQQHPDVIDKGVFHNDVIAVANESVLMLHQHAFLNQKEVYDSLLKHMDIQIFEFRDEQLSVEDAVNTYLFNSQILTLPDKSMLLLAPSECEHHPRVRPAIDDLLSMDNPVNQVKFMDLRQSMQNGGGPACLRLRVPLTESEYQAVHSGVLITDELLDKLTHWIKTHYRDRLHVDDLCDVSLVDECFKALLELEGILDLKGIYQVN